MYAHSNQLFMCTNFFLDCSVAVTNLNTKSRDYVLITCFTFLLECTYVRSCLECWYHGAIENMRDLNMGICNFDINL